MLGGIFSRFGRRGLIRGATTGVAAGAATVLGAGPIASPVGAQQSPEVIIGSWLVKIPGRNRDIVSMMAFNASGIVIQADSPIDAADPDEEDQHHDYASTGLGMWTRTGDRRYSYKFHVIEYDETGGFDGIETEEGDLTVDATGNAWTAQIVWTQTAPDGTVDARHENRIGAARISVGA